jgi:hypothetical protein
MQQSRKSYFWPQVSVGLMSFYTCNQVIHHLTSGEIWRFGIGLILFCVSCLYIGWVLRGNHEWLKRELDRTKPQAGPSTNRNIFDA